ncbi:MAG TPA: PIN domain-containing protein [Thermoanaerobaculia bacterium]|nr:PIN domain-containing protein [Thermoanaerobaculia bacterium]
MASLIYLDTHVVTWLRIGRTDALPQLARRLLEENDLLISPFVVLELQYLFEIQRASEPAEVVLAALTRDIGLEVCELPFVEVARMALGQSWTRDPFDRIIVSQAALRNAPLVTRDQLIRDHYSQAVWD